MTGWLEEIEARANAATPGPWEEDDNYYDGPYFSLRVVGNDDMDLFNGVGPEPYYCQNCTANASFAAHAREDIPWLCANLRETRKELAALLKLEALHRRVERERYEKLLARNTVLERVAEAATRVVANQRQIRYPSRVDGRRIYGDLPYFEERAWLVEDADFVCLRIATLAALEANTERRTECDSLNQ